MLLIGTSAAGLTASVFRDAEHRHAETALVQRAQDTRTALAAEVRRYIDALQDLSVATAAQSDLTAQDFTMITSRMRHERLPGASAVLFIAASGTFQYGRMVDTPADWPAVVPGLDPATPDRQAADRAEAASAMAAARSSGQITASLPLPFASAGEAQTSPAIVLAGPVYAGPATPDAAAFRGWVLLTLRIDPVLAQALQRSADDTTRVVVSDVTDPTSPVPVAGSESGTDAPGRRVDLTVATRSWLLTVTTTGPLVTGPAAYTDEATFAGGLLITIVLAAVAWLLSTSRERALARVEQSTAALRADIARREAAEAQLRDRESELAGFLAVTAHDLRTPLTNVAAYADLLSEIAAEDLDPTCRGFLDRIGSGTRRMTRLIDDLLDFARAENAPLRPQPIDLHDLFTEVVSEHTAHLGDGRPNIDLGPLPTIHGDLATLRRLLDNLLGNAIKYVRHGDTAQVSIGARREPDGWRIEVADRGIGIPPEKHQAVFAAFHRDRAAEGYPGTGLGLAICKRIAERHGGHIGVEANPGGGSRFWFTLPAVPRVEQVADADGTTPATALTNTR